MRNSLRVSRDAIMLLRSEVDKFRAKARYDPLNEVEALLRRTVPYQRQRLVLRVDVGPVK